MGQRETHSRSHPRSPILYPEGMNDRSTKARERLKDKKWDGLEPMIEAHAAEAVAVAKADFHESLDWDDLSVERLERILNRLCPAPEPLPAGDGEWLTVLWGSYFGELLRHLHGGTWIMSVYPGSDFSVPTLEVEGARLYPTLKVNRRLTMGAGESLTAFHALMQSRLAAARDTIH
jgi:hypothetical protein